MQSIVVDTGPLIALFDRDDRYHAEAKEFIGAVRVRLVTNLAVLTAAAFGLRFSGQAQRDMLLWVHDSFIIDRETATDLPRIVALLEKYRDMPAGFADASLVAMAERRGLFEVASIDRDFDRYRTFGKRAFTNVFFGSG